MQEGCDSDTAAFKLQLLTFYHPPILKKVCTNVVITVPL